MNRFRKMVMVCYVNEYLEWQPFFEAELVIAPKSDLGFDLKLMLKQPLPADRLTVLPLLQIYREAEMAICIGVQRVSEIQKMGDLILAINLEQWNRVLSLSFRDEEYCSLVKEQIDLELSSSNQLPLPADQFIKYIAEEIASAPFANPIWLDQAVQKFKSMMEIVRDKKALTEEEERNYFKFIKSYINSGHIKELQILIEEENFPSVLKCLSFNFEFGDRRIDYPQEYAKIAKCRNVLEFEEEAIIRNYRDIMKLRFLMDTATSMFIELYTQTIINEMIRDRTFQIIRVLVEHPTFMHRFKELVRADPLLFLEFFSELWEMFKLIIEDQNTKNIKNAFYTAFVDENLIGITIYCLGNMVESGKGQYRLYQKLLDSFNPFLSYKWNQSQEFLVSSHKNNKYHLLKVLLNLLALDDYGTKVAVLHFARFLIDITEIRRTMKQSFYSYFFSEFVSKLCPYFHTAQDLQLLVQFFMKCYKLDVIRTRRCIIQGTLLTILQQGSQKKHILILILRLLRLFLSSKEDAIFLYLSRHKRFTCLREAYFISKKYTPRGILHSMFTGLLKDCEHSSNKPGIAWVYSIMCPQES